MSRARPALDTLVVHAGGMRRPRHDRRRQGDELRLSSVAVAVDRGTGDSHAATRVAKRAPGPACPCGCATHARASFVHRKRGLTIVTWYPDNQFRISSLELDFWYHFD